MALSVHMKEDAKVPLIQTDQEQQKLVKEEPQHEQIPQQQPLVKEEPPQEQPPRHLQLQQPTSQPLPATISTHTPLPPPPTMYPVQSVATSVSWSSATTSSPSTNTHPLPALPLPGRPRDPRLARQAPLYGQQVAQQMPIVQQPSATTQSSMLQQRNTPPLAAAVSQSLTLEQTNNARQMDTLVQASQPQQPMPQVATRDNQAWRPSPEQQQPSTTHPGHLLTAKQEPTPEQTRALAKQRLDQIRAQQRILNSKRMELTLNCRNIIDALPYDDRRGVLIEALKTELKNNIEANTNEDRELENEYQSILLYLKRADALDSNDYNGPDGALKSVASLLAISSGGSHGDTVWVSPMDVNELKIKRVAMIFALDRVPISDLSTMQIDHAQLKLPTINGSPTLDFGVDSTMPKSVICLKVVEQLESFISRFKTVHMALLDEVLFEELAYLFMGRALTPAGYATLFKNAIQDEKYKNKKWKDVVQCLHDILQIDRARFEVFKHLMCIKPLSQEKSRTYADRIESMVRVANAEPHSDMVIKAIIASLPPAGCKKLEKELNGFQDVKDIHTLLNQMRRIDDLLDGSLVDPYGLWLKAADIAAANKKQVQHGPKPGSGSSAPGAKPSSASDEYQYRQHHSNGGPSRPNHKGGPSSEKGGHLTDGNYRREHGSKPYARPGSSSQRAGRHAEDSSEDRMCSQPMCAARGLIHEAAKCYSITNPAKYKGMLKNYNNRNNNG